MEKDTVEIICKYPGYTFAYKKYSGLVPFNTTHYKVYIDRRMAEYELKNNETDMEIVECEIRMKS